MAPIDPLSGLTQAEAALRLTQEGPNELGSSERRTLLGELIAVLREPMTLLLLGCGGLYLVLGDVQESLLLLGFVIFILGITLAQQRKTARALEALRDLASPRALVIRDGTRLRIAGREVVRGDLVVVSEGDRIPADGRLLEALNLGVDESLVTGESLPVRKQPWDGVAPITRPRGDDLPFVFAGTLVVHGTGIAEVLAVAAQTEIGRIGKALSGVVEAETPLQRETKVLVKKLAWLAGGLSLAVALAYGLLRHDWLDGILAGLTLAMAILPNEFPVVVTIFLALGAWRLSKVRVLARSTPAVEALGSATVLCVDKTGTLTENRMRVSTLVGGGQTFALGRLSAEALPEAVHLPLEYSILASRRDPFDPMERAFKELGEQQLAGSEHLHPDWKLLREYPLKKELLAVAQAWETPDSAERWVAAKGAPEAIVELALLAPEARSAVLRQVEQLAADGLRVLAVARAPLEPGASLPDDVRSLAFEHLGLVGLADPIRADVPAAIAECRAAGIKVAMITGDYPSTAEAIARAIGLELRAPTLRGDQIEAMSDQELGRRIADTTVFARVLPEQKLRLVQAFRARGEVVAMTGDGVNDAPALRAADIGVAMGARGTDVAREAAALVLLEDDFGSLVHAMRTGRRIVDNLKKALAFVLAVHLPIIGLTIIPIAMGWPLVLMPIHVAFLHLIIDPACSVIFEAEPEEREIMKRPPRNPREPLFGKKMLWLSGLQGLMVMLVTIGVYAFALYNDEPETQARALSFTTLIVADLGLIFTNRSWSSSILRSLSTPNPWLWWVSGGTLAFLAAVLYIPPLAELFRFSGLHPDDLLVSLMAGGLSVLWFELLKRTGLGPKRGSTMRQAVPTPS